MLHACCRRLPPASKMSAEVITLDDAAPRCCSNGAGRGCSLVSEARFGVVPCSRHAQQRSMMRALVAGGRADAGSPPCVRLVLASSRVAEVVHRVLTPSCVRPRRRRNARSPAPAARQACRLRPRSPRPRRRRRRRRLRRVRRRLQGGG